MSSSLGSIYPSLLPLLRLHAVQPLHQAGDALLQAVDGVVLRVVAAETVAQAAESIAHQLQVIRLSKRPGEVRQSANQELRVNPYFPTHISSGHDSFFQALKSPLQGRQLPGKGAE